MQALEKAGRGRESKLTLRVSNYAQGSGGERASATFNAQAVPLIRTPGNFSCLT
jgi:hypothetical protein